VLPLAVCFIDIPMRALSIFLHSVGGRKLRDSSSWSAKLMDSLPGQRVEIVKLTGVIPQVVVKLSLWRTTARLPNKFFLWKNPWTG
jgi:hypothetical protein